MVRGIESHQEQDSQQLLRDTRTLGKRFVDFFKNPNNVVIVLVTMAISGFFLPGFSDLLLLIGLLAFSYCYFRPATLPFRMPQTSHLPDFNDPLPGSKKPRTARGISFFGNDIKTNEEIWFNNDDMRTHALVFGSTGSGKTEALVSIAFNSLLQGSGFIYVDGKGDNSLFAKVFSMCRSMGREDDILLVNFMTGARDVIGAQKKRLSNTMNPFCMGSSSMLANLVTSLMPDSGGGSSDGDMWKGRAIVFVEALMRVLVYMRDQGHILLDANTIRNYFILERLEAIAIDRSFIRDNQEPVDMTDVPFTVLEPIYNYVINLPGYDKSKKGKQVSQVLEQHGFITMQLTRVFGSLADTYGHIIRTNLAEVDFKDVVLNRRILVVLLPALEKAPDELANLGKVIIASLKAMMAAGLGDEVEGEYRDLILRKPTSSPAPYVCIMDEYGYYAVKGFAVVPAQARSLGFSAIFAGQDLPAFQKASKEEAASIGANCNIKICMKLEDPTDTWEFFLKSAGESYVTKVDSFQTDPNSVTNTYMDTRSSSVEKRARIDLLDLKDQREGEAHIFFKSKIVRAKMFYAAPKPVGYMRLNQYLKVEKPPTKILEDLQKRYTHFQDVIGKPEYFASTHVESEEITNISTDLTNDEYLDPIERSISALLSYQNREQESRVVEPEIIVPEDMLNIFTKLRLSPADANIIITNDMNTFSSPLLARADIRENVETIERSSGKMDKYAANIADEIVKDMEIATRYPPDIQEKPGAWELSDIAKGLIDKIVKARLAAATAQTTS